MTAAAEDVWTERELQENLLLSSEPLDLAYEVLERSGLADDLIRWTTSPRGRTARGLTVVDVLAGAIALAVQGRSPLLREIAKVLHHEMPRHQRVARGITRPWPTVERSDERLRMIRAAEEAVRRRFVALVNATDATVVRRNRSRPILELVDDMQAQHTRDPEGTGAARAREVMLDVMNRVVQGSLEMVPDHVVAQIDGTFAIDGTFTPTWASGPRGHRPAKAILRAVRDAEGGVERDDVVKAARINPGGTSSADPEAGWYIRNYGSGDVIKGFGYEANLAVVTDAASQTNSVRVPSLVLGVTIDAPSFDPGPNAIELVERVQQWATRRGEPMKIAVLDALYPTLGLEFKRDLRKNGVVPLHRLPTRRLGKSGASFEGNVLVEGTWYCSEMPKKLVDASKDKEAGRISEARYKELLEARRVWESYRVTGNDVLDAEGNIKSHRFECPSSRRGGEHTCVRDAATTAGPGAIPLPVKALPTTTPRPKACAQKTFTIPASLGLEHEQALPYMTPEWKALNNRFRSMNEGKNAGVKDPTKEAIGIKGVRRVNGMAANGLLLACQLAANNLRSTKNFLLFSKTDSDGVAIRRYSAYRKGRPYRSKVPGLTTPTPSGRAPSARAAAVSP